MCSYSTCLNACVVMQLMVFFSLHCIALGCKCCCCVHNSGTHILVDLNVVLIEVFNVSDEFKYYSFFKDSNIITNLHLDLKKFEYAGHN